MTLEEFKSSEYARAPHFMLIGKPVSHSLSPLMHNTAAQFYDISTRYIAVQLQSEELGTFAAYLNAEQLKGVNITIPYKQLVMDYVDEFSESCRHIGALNTIVKRGQTLTGHNTDAYGFLKPLESYKSEIKNSRAVIFGTGGASKAIVYALNKWKVEETILVSRNPHHKENTKWPDNVQFCSYDSWSSYAEEASLIVNATPLGMEPNEQGCPLKETDKKYLADKICYDIVYKPQKTTFLKMAEQVDARTIGGLEMLIHQGSRSFELWTGKQFPIEIIRNKLNNHLHHVH